MPSINQASAVARFRDLHESGCFILPNPWNVGTAKFLEHAGFEAIATTSAGLAFSRGLPDTVDALPHDLVLDHIAELASATSLPLNADFQAGYSDDADGVFRNVASCVSTGVAGLSIEDASGDSGQPLFDRTHAVDRIRAARAAIDQSGTGVVLTGRCEAWLVGEPTPLRTVLDRLVEYADAGADCLYAPGTRDPREIEEIVRAVDPKPVNVLMSAPVEGLSLSRLVELGVRRVSVGSAFARVAWGAFIQVSESIRRTGSFDALGEAATFSELNALFGPS